MVWVAASVIAAFLQNLRSSAQKKLTGELTTHGAAATRFLFGLPFALIWLWVVYHLGASSGELHWPAPSVSFVLFALGGSLAQIAGTTLLIASFSRRSFAVGTTYSKTEGIQAVVFGLVFLGDRVSAGGLAGVVFCVAGVLAVSIARPAPGMDGRAMNDASEQWQVAGIGLVSGAMFAVSGVCYRGAALALGDENFLLRAALTLVFALCVQSALTALHLALYERGQLTQMARAWRWGLAAGAAGAFASAGWFTAFTLANAAYVKAVGSIELLFALATSWLMFGERPTRYEGAGVGLVMLGVIVTVMFR